MVEEPKTYTNKMENIINQNVLKREIRRLVKEELQKEMPKNHINSFWKYLNELSEKIKVLERK